MSYFTFCVLVTHTETHASAICLQTKMEMSINPSMKLTIHFVYTFSHKHRFFIQILFCFSFHGIITVMTKVIFFKFIIESITRNPATVHSPSVIHFDVHHCICSCANSIKKNADEQPNRHMQHEILVNVFLLRLFFSCYFEKLITVQINLLDIAKLDAK